MTLGEPKPKVILNLGGTDYELPPFNLNLMVAIENEFGGMGNIVQSLESKQMDTTLKLLTILLKKHNLTSEQIGEMITLQNLREVSQKIFEAIGG